MIVIAYSSAPGYENMVGRLERILCHTWDIKLCHFTRKWLETIDFYRENKSLLDIPHGNGLWAWKPFIILEALAQEDEVIYLDSSVVPSSKDELFRILSDTKDISAPRVSDEYPHKLWTKRDCFREMNCDRETWWNASHVWAGVITAKSSGIPIVKDWLKFCLNFKAISDDPGEDNFPGFIKHMNDQSILANVLHAYDQPLLDGRDSFKDLVDYDAR